MRARAIERVWRAFTLCATRYIVGVAQSSPRSRSESEGVVSPWVALVAPLLNVHGKGKGGGQAPIPGLAASVSRARCEGRASSQARRRRVRTRASCRRLDEQLSTRKARPICNIWLVG